MKRALLLLLIFSTTTYAQQSMEVVYKKIDSTELTIKLDYPPDYQPGRRYATIVFFFGGGWVNGRIGQFDEHARYFASRGMVCAQADYRVRNRHGTTPFESVADAKSAVRYLRQHADLLGIDEGRLIAAGGSAGAHLAAAVAQLPGLDDPKDDLTISTVPQALVLYNPVIDNGPKGYGHERIGERYPEFSPFHNLNTVSPPTIFFLGTEDNLVPVSTAKAYQKKVEARGGRCDLHLYEGQPHGFFNYKNLDNFK
ncbi:alpha/beta hydrolase, partial [Persicitalea sp.]|uniref:alpha/beta hydrolase n=1 Tax=Persicitalea sp. TaxID=3100273 RepID=UPI003593DD5A